MSNGSSRLIQAESRQAGHHQTPGGFAVGTASADQEAGPGNDGRPDRHDHQAPQEGRAGEDRWSRNPGGSQARRPHGPQSDDWRSDQDQSQQEGCLPRVQGSEDGDLIVSNTVSQNPADRRRGFCLARTATAHNLRSASYSAEQYGPP